MNASAPDYQTILDDIREEVRPLLSQGEVANYIPRLAVGSADKFGMAVVTLDGLLFQTGDSDDLFSMQSLSKLYTVALALQPVGDRLWGRVGREPSGNPFNSLVQLEQEHGKPRNPFINAGALVVADVLLRICGRRRRRHARQIRSSPKPASAMTRGRRFRTRHGTATPPWRIS